ncbi:MAG: formate--tetrahydrofolate ligase [Planctomycetes bacterium]|nr:formate--tetrahydrofolate ligase [Planctomycetota bacterium]
MQPDLEIARNAHLSPLFELVSKWGVSTESLIPYGHYMAKVDHRVGLAPPAADSKLVLVTAITPTPAGEGKTVHTIGLSLALNRLGKSAAATIRQPSMGPVFGMKGGAAGGGYSQVLPMEDINLHLTGDFHAVTAAHNLMAAALDTSVLLDNPLEIDPERILIKRVVDVNDRCLREIQVGLGGKLNGVPRTSGFEITSASEVMAVLGLARDLPDMRARLGRIIVAETFGGQPVTAEQIGVAGAMAAILAKALDPTLLQTTEGTPALVHTGPFANIAHGNSSVVADRVAATFCEYVVTEGGFGADMGAEKFFSIKSPASGMQAKVALLVATVRALKMHSGRYQVKPGRPLPEELMRPDLEALAEGCANMDAQLDNVRAHGIPVVVAINRFSSDTDEELELVRKRALAGGACGAFLSEVHAKGGAGGEEIARAIIEAAESGQANPKPLYDPEAPLIEKLEILAQNQYGADGIQFESEALAQLQKIGEQGGGCLPVCVAKTQYSLSHDPGLKGRPTGFTLPIRALRLAAGAGFVIAYVGKIMTMPGLGRKPAYKDVDLDEEGLVEGLF